MPETRCFAYFRCASFSEIPLALQKRRIQEYCASMGYELFSEIDADEPCDDVQAENICEFYRTDMGLSCPLKMIVLNLHRLGPDLHMVRRAASIFRDHDITIESTVPADNELLTMTEQDEYELFNALLNNPSDIGII